jgi:hypothetical protein
MYDIGEGGKRDCAIAAIDCVLVRLPSQEPLNIKEGAKFTLPLAIDPTTNLPHLVEFQAAVDIKRATAEEARRICLLFRFTDNKIYPIQVTADLGKHYPELGADLVRRMSL